MISGRLKVLADRDDIAIDRSQVTHDLPYFVDRFPHSKNQPGLGRHTPLFGSAQQIDRSLILTLRSDRGKESAYGLDVMVENFRFRGAHGFERRLATFKVGDQDFDRATGTQPPGFSDGFRKYGGAAVSQLVAIDRRNDGVSERQGANCLGHATGFLVVDGRWSSRLDGTIVTTPGAGVAEDQEGCSAGIPALPPVRTARFFTYGVELESIDGVPDIKIIRARCGFDFEPGRQSLAIRALSVDRDEAHEVFSGWNLLHQLANQENKP